MGDFRITIEAVGGHGCGRATPADSFVDRCHRDDCPDCQAAAFAKGIRGATVYSAKLEHWPVPGAAGTTRTEGAGPVDDLVTGIRAGKF